MFDINQAHVRFVRLMFDMSQTLFHMCQTHVQYVSVSCLICLRLIFDMSQAHISYVSDSCSICVRLMLKLSQSHDWYVSDSCSICLRLLFVWDLSNSDSEMYQTVSQRCIKQVLWDILNSKTDLSNSKLETYQQQGRYVPNIGLKCTKHRSEM